jgi:hypothetical protein
MQWSKIEKLTGEDFSHFRLWTSTEAVIAIAILVINIGF